MRAATIRDNRVVVDEHPDPEPGAGEVLVRVRAAGVNNADLLQAAGFYPAPPGAPPDIPGLELAGEVVGLGRGAARFSVGDRVMAVVAGGAQAELAVVHERALMPVPDGVPWDEAGAIPEAYMTAHDALFTQAGLAMGERACIHGAAGGVGTAAVHLAASAGAQVVATVRNDALHDGVRALGAAVVVTPDDFVGHGPFDVVLELIGAPNMAGNLEALAVRGRVVVIGVGGGSSVDLNLLALMAKRGRISASTLRARPLEEKADAARRMEAHVLPLLVGGRHRVPVAATYPLDEVAAAYERFRAGGKLGKIVVQTAV